jgi:hypothetical protein
LAFIDAGLNEILDGDSVGIIDATVVLKPLTVRKVSLLANRLIDLANHVPQVQSVTASSDQTILQEVSKVTIDETFNERHSIPIGYSLALVKLDQ